MSKQYDALTFKFVLGAYDKDDRTMRVNIQEAEIELPKDWPQNLIVSTLIGLSIRALQIIEKIEGNNDYEKDICKIIEDCVEVIKKTEAVTVVEKNE